MVVITSNPERRPPTPRPPPVQQPFTPNGQWKKVTLSSLSLEMLAKYELALLAADMCQAGGMEAIQAAVQHAFQSKSHFSISESLKSVKKVLCEIRSARLEGLPVVPHTSVPLTVWLEQAAQYRTGGFRLVPMSAAPKRNEKA